MVGSSIAICYSRDSLSYHSSNPYIFSWYFTFMLLNCGQLLYIVYLLRPIYFDPVLEEAYEKVFKPMAVTRLQFKKLVTAGDAAQIVCLHSGECYAVENMTKTDRLALLISGRVVVLTEKRFLHHVDPLEFLDSPEFEGCNLTG